MAAVEPKAGVEPKGMAEHKLTIVELVDWLLEDGMIDASEADKIRRSGATTAARTTPWW